MVDKLFHDSLVETREMSPRKAGNKKRLTLIIPKINTKKKVVARSFKVRAQTLMNPTE